MMKEHKEGSLPLCTFLVRMLQGMLIGLGAVLPGISGGVLCVIFGIYRPVMELLSNPRKYFFTHIRKLLPVILGGAVGFLGVANILSFFLEKYPDPSVCLFVGLIAGMLPSLMREAGKEGRTNGSWISMVAAAVVIFAILTTLNLLSVSLVPNVGWYVFCGVCLALSVIVPGMSFSTLLMPLGLYTPFVDGLGHLNLSIMIPSGIGAVVTVICFAKMIDALLEKFYSYVFHAIVGIVVAATVMIIPFGSFTVSLSAAIVNVICLGLGVLCSLLLNRIDKDKIPPHQPENAGDAAVFFVCLFEVVITICHGKSSCQLFFLTIPVIINYRVSL